MEPNLSNMKKLRKKKKLSQQDLADIVGTTQQNIYKYENGYTQPDIGMLCKFADLLETSIDYIVGRTDVDGKIEKKSPSELNDKEMRMVGSYRALSESGKSHVEETIRWFSPDK